MDKFQGAGAQPGVQIWRIEAMEPAHVAPADFGKFFVGDCYLVLHTQRKGRAMVWDIYFWIGANCSHDERGAVALWAVNLDDFLGGDPVQHREVQEHESGAFMRLFKEYGGIEYVEGGVASGFRTVNRDAFVKQLFWLKGRRNVRVRPVEVSAGSLNHGDVFVLSAGPKIYQWNGAESSRLERAKGLDFTTKLRDEGGAKARVVPIDDGQEPPEFWEALGGSASDVKSAASAGVDEETEKAHSVKLYRVSDASGSLQITEIATAPLERSMLDPQDAFIVHASGMIFVWVGKKATRDEKRGAMQHAEKFIERFNLPVWTSVTRVVGGAETALFKENFKNFDVQKVSVDFSRPVGGRKSKKVAGKEISFTLAKQAQAKQMEFKGTPVIQVFRIQNNRKVAVPESEFGIFFTGDSYIVQVAYTQGRQVTHVVYFWQGAKSGQDERGASALLTCAIDEEMGGEAVQVRVSQNREPPYFVSLWNNRMVVVLGDWDKPDTSENKLYHIRGTCETDTRAVQVACECSNLSSGDCFILTTEDTVFIWQGRGSNEVERYTALQCAEAVATPDQWRSVVNEGEESDEFWRVLGGRSAYNTEFSLAAAEYQPRLFQCSDALGTYRVEEIVDFDQSDLVDDDVMIVDNFDTVYVWVGSGSTDNEKVSAVESAKSFIAQATDGRSKNAAIVRVDAGAEPQPFKALFQGWSDEVSEGFKDPYAAKLAKLKAERDDGPAWARKSSRGGFVDPLEKKRAASAEQENPWGGVQLRSRK